MVTENRRVNADSVVPASLVGPSILVGYGLGPPGP
jgi:hypothetical protein